MENEARKSRESWFRKKYWLLWFGGFFLTSNIAFTTTPLIWMWSGRQSESYPELFFLYLGIPSALIFLIAGLFVATQNPSTRLESGMKILWLAVWVEIVLLLLDVATFVFTALPVRVGNSMLEIQAVLQPVLILVVLGGGIVARLQSKPQK